MNKVNFLLIRLYRFMEVIGIVLALVGSMLMALGFAGFINLDVFAFGLSAGIRVVGSLAISGCLLGAIGCFGLEFNNVSS
jgi:hypothetical protein